MITFLWFRNTTFIADMCLFQLIFLSINTFPGDAGASVGKSSDRILSPTSHPRDVRDYRM
jgi:hypothetical protein